MRVAKRCTLFQTIGFHIFSSRHKRTRFIDVFACLKYFLLTTTDYILVLFYNEGRLKCHEFEYHILNSATYDINIFYSLEFPAYPTEYAVAWWRISQLNIILVAIKSSSLYTPFTWIWLLISKKVSGYRFALAVFTQYTTMIVYWVWLRFSSATCIHERNFQLNIVLRWSPFLFMDNIVNVLMEPRDEYSLWGNYDDI